MRVPVLPSPALQCTANGGCLVCRASRKASTLSFSVRIWGYLIGAGAVGEDHINVIDSVLQEELAVVLLLVQPDDCINSAFVELR